MASSLLEPQPPSLARQHYRGRIHSRRKAIKALRFAAWIALLLFTITAFYVGKRGFGRQWRYRIVEELRKRGVEVAIQRLTLDPFRGLVAQDVRVFDFKNHDNVLAVISEVAVDINYAALLHHQPFVNALEVRDARVTIPLGTNPGMPDRARITNFRAHVYFPPDQIYVNEVEGIFAGVRISGTGQVIRRADYQAGPPVSEEEWRQRMQLLQRIVKEISSCSFAGGEPWLQIKFSADLSKPESARCMATLTAPSVRRGQYEIRNLRAAAEWAEQRLAVTQCEWSDASGAFSARLAWDSKTGSGDFQARSSLRLNEFLAACGFPNPLARTTFNSPPLLELSGTIGSGDSAPRLSVIGRVSAANFTCKRVQVASASTDFAWDGARTMLRNVLLRHESGSVAADLLDAPGDFRLNLRSTVNPGAIREIFPEEAARFLGEWEWQRSPELQLMIRGSSRSPASWTGEGNVAFDRTRFRGAWMNNASAKLRFANHSVNFDNFRIARDEGVGTGTCAYDFSVPEIRLTNVKTNLRPTDAIMWVEPKLYKHVAPYKFRQVPNVTVNGRVQFHGGTGDHLELIVDAPTGMEYVFIGKTLPIDRVSGRLLFTNDRLQISDLNGTLFGGAVRGGVDISLTSGDPHYRANVAVEGVNFPSLTNLYFDYKTAQGRLAGTFDWKGFSDDRHRIDGTGKLRVSEGNVFAIPIFGPLSTIMGAIIPGAGYSVAHQATADFSIKEGVIHTDNFKVSGRLFGMVGHGDIRFIEDKLDFDVKISGGGPGALLTPVYNLFEYKGEGSITKPNWHPKHF
ncbi:MAG: AsmA-like C-terminal region-containing protein [Chthoniobacterales bacterium]